MQTNLKLLIVLFLTAFLLSGCSRIGQLFLHNASEEMIVLSVTYVTHDGFGTKDYAIKPDEVRIVHLNFYVEHEVSVRFGEKSWCYQIGVMPTDWVKPSLSGPKVYANVLANGFVYIYPRSAKETSFFTKSPTDQPSGFPLEPGHCS